MITYNNETFVAYQGGVGLASVSYYVIPCAWWVQ